MLRIEHPGIHVIGNIREDIGGRVAFTGWGVTHCAQHCNCHRNPLSGCMEVLDETGSLGLRQFRACYCCRPWTVDELQAVIRTLHEIQAQPTAEEQPS